MSRVLKVHKDLQGSLEPLVLKVRLAFKGRQAIRVPKELKVRQASRASRE